ncbi:Retrovirus-related Pol polyprotein from transposon TNT 1-94 [Vitis vinifera]|uniref:Retrovirus-related Pol polyprotein from transposon TNT 1-94 n=1 Tax=Vitis vinifera TaxID=29760 RepID=A0A438GWB7_VITVI|nr:Retrovirus-related Pol polyprotein from transposon TNT 1-94 [Vitis vinifera]
MVVNVHESRNYEAVTYAYPTAQEIWSALSKAFYDASDELQVFTLNKKPSLPNKVIASSRRDSTQRSSSGFGRMLCIDSTRAVRHASMKVESDNLDTSAMDIQTRQTIGYGIKRGKLYYLDLQSKDSNKLRQALMADGPEGERKKSKIGLWHRRLGHASFGGYQKEIQTLNYDYHISKEDESGQSELVNQEVEAFVDPRWKAAMNEEMKSLQKNETWKLVERPLGKKPVRCRWIYTVKYKADDQHSSSITVFSCNLDWSLQQFDVKNVFLHGELSKEVYMDLPPGCMVLEKQCQEETGMSGCQPVDTPIEEGLKLCVEPNQVSTDKGRYQRLVGRLMYLVHTRPDPAYALSVDLGYLSRQPIRLFCDNKAACDIAHNPVQHDRTKYVEVDRFFIKEKLDDKIVELPKIRSENQLTYILTKLQSQVECSQNF